MYVVFNELIADSMLYNQYVSMSNLFYFEMYFFFQYWLYPPPTLFKASFEIPPP